MSGWKTILAILAVALALWLLYPSRQLGPAESASLIEITFMGPGGVIQGEMDDLLREFERRSEAAHRRDPSRPLYRIVYGQTAARNQVEDPTRFLVSVAGGTPPDVIHFDRYAIGEWAGRGAFEPLDGYIERDLEAVKAGRLPNLTPADIPTADRFFKAAWDEAVYKGRVYGIPNGIDNRALYYNEDLLIAAGYKEVAPDGTVRARPPANWEQCKQYAARLTQRDEDGTIQVIGFPAYYGNSWLYMYGWMNGGKFMSDDRRRCTLNDSRIAKALDFMKEVYDLQGGYPKVKGFEAGFQRNEMDPFIQGKIAMKIDGVWVLQWLAKYGRDLKFNCAPPPMPQDRIDGLKAAGKPPLISWSGGWAYAIPTTARHKKEAWELIRWLTSDRAFHIRAENDRLLHEAQGRLFVPLQCPVKKVNQELYETYVLGNDRLPRRFKEAYKTFNDLLPYSKYRPVTPVGQLLWNKHRDAAEEILDGSNRTSQQALDYHTAIVQRRLDKVLAPPAGKPISDWTWFFILYAFLLAVFGGGAVLWDTSRRFRSRVARMLGLSKQRAEGVIEGSAGGYFRRRWFGGYVCAAPWILGFLLLAGGPMLFSFVMSFCDFDVINPARFIGLENYRSMVSGDELFWKALYNTAFMLIGVPLGMAVSLAMAMLLNAKVRGIAVWRSFFYLPAIVPMVAASILWIWIFNPQGGLINRFLTLAGLPGPLWLQSQTWSKPAIIIMGLWGAGAGMIIWLAGLKGISRQLYEAAEVDGAGAWQKFRHITLPQLTPYIFFNLVMGTIYTFQIFGQAFIMTQGGPVNSTLFYVYYLFNNAFRYGHMGYAAAMAWFLFVIVFLLTVFQLKLSKRWVYYESE